ncbi:MAG: type I restriction enzyme HsdR N-terminal domain-containing protein [Bacteroidota bacterium]|nr:type I restriction enzyme HsdR N-terminal domain-containing protein [Bacteroidota bacterium]MDP3146237.1 type I restriction enzyme HsdR N-terminal domain-containing protein [Bacteroidota bacterium]MDP3558136.1 type I restriction enzyme HsdR N-terminal domain-containing protein [Bacteroidota bacterium]
MNLPIKYPLFNTRLKKQKEQTYIFDEVRKKWLVLTPEEWVRQHLIHFLIKEKKYPSSLISIEKEIILNDLKKRYDIVVYNKQLKPILIIECKAPYIDLDKTVVEQALRYNLIIKADYLMISNGVSDFTFNSSNEQIILPDYLEL